MSRLMAVVLCSWTLIAAGCGDDDGGGGGTTVADTGGEDGGGGTSDGGAEDTGGATDTGGDDTGTTDTGGGEDTGGDDSGTADTGGDDSGTTDTGGTEDTGGSDDTGGTEDAGIDVIEPGDFCDDPTAGSGTTPAPEPAEANSFTTELVACSLSPAEVGACYGAIHASTVRLTATTLEITSNAIPNHDAGIFPNSGNPNVVRAQNLTWSIPLEPTWTGEPVSARIPGVGLNGIKMEPETAEVYSDGQWRYEALTFMGRIPSDSISMPVTSLGADCNFAHVQPNGEYHYHGNPTALMPVAPARVQVGWAADGYPIFGRYGFTNPAGTGELVELDGSYRLKSGTREPLGAGDVTPPGAYDGTFVQDWEFVDGAGDLDACNGRAETNVIDGRAYDYAYYLTHTYPFMPRCLMGEPADFAGAGGGGDPGGGGGPTTCVTNRDCEAACADAPRGCECIETPMGDRVCAPICATADDCAEGFLCGREGVCIPEMGGGGRP